MILSVRDYLITYWVHTWENGCTILSMSKSSSNHYQILSVVEDSPRAVPLSGSLCLPATPHPVHCLIVVRYYRLECGFSTGNLEGSVTESWFPRLTSEFRRYRFSLCQRRLILMSVWHVSTIWREETSLEKMPLWEVVIGHFPLQWLMGEGPAYYEWDLGWWSWVL